MPWLATPSISASSQEKLGRGLTATKPQEDIAVAPADVGAPKLGALAKTFAICLVEEKRLLINAQASPLPQLSASSSFGFFLEPASSFFVSSSSSILLEALLVS